MRILLDTNVFLWATVDPARLGRHRQLLEDPENERLVSVVSSWEIAIKTGLGRLRLPEPVSTWVPTRLVALAATVVPVELDSTLLVAGLPTHHRDPFDRLLVAQAQVLGVPIMTADRVLERYDVELLLVA